MEIKFVFKTNSKLARFRSKFGMQSTLGLLQTGYCFWRLELPKWKYSERSCLWYCTSHLLSELLFGWLVFILSSQLFQEKRRRKIRKCWFVLFHPYGKRVRSSKPPPSPLLCAQSSALTSKSAALLWFLHVYKRESNEAVSTARKNHQTFFQSDINLCFCCFLQTA